MVYIHYATLWKLLGKTQLKKYLKDLMFNIYKIDETFVSTHEVIFS